MSYFTFDSKNRAAPIANTIMINTKTKILPIIVEGLFSIKPKNRWTIIPQPVKLIIKDPIDVLNKSVDDVLEEVESIYLNHELK